MVRRDEDGYWLEHEQPLAMHHEEVFACLTTDGGLMRWFAVAARIEARAGGLLELGWDRAFRSKSTLAVLEFDAGGKIRWDWYAGNADTHAPLEWRVEPDVEQGSVVRLIQGPFRADTESLVAMAEEAQFWTWQLCNMKSVLEAKHDMRRVRPL
ncbi:MAG: SRPBCC domain-containing protein [Phycisphaeraceae bacterium]|nr:SRPBCC domain-containing protein [Phycisphaeraceae bacterium]